MSRRHRDWGVLHDDGLLEAGLSYREAVRRVRELVLDGFDADVVELFPDEEEEAL